MEACFDNWLDDEPSDLSGSLASEIDQERHARFLAASRAHREPTTRLPEDTPEACPPAAGLPVAWLVAAVAAGGATLMAAGGLVSSAAVVAVMLSIL